MRFICMVFRGIDLKHQRVFASRREANEYAGIWLVKIAGSTPYDVVIKELR
jgi:hypothetical protein